MAEARYRGRFAPSPTGPLHLGSLYTALAGFLQAKVHRGQWLLRIDDVDPYRIARGSADRIKASLEILGLHWDGPIVHQSGRAEAYDAALTALQSGGLVYSCTCSRKELADSDAGGVYPGFCRSGQAAPDKPASLRILTQGARIAFNDRVQGRTEQNLETEVGDFILFRRDLVFAYHLATVLDDAEQGITEVLRGIDLLDSTPRQIYLQRCLGLPEPGYAHIPVLVDANGQKLSKQSHAPEAEIRNAGGLLYYLLTLLNQDPPAELASAPPAEILPWAIAHWELGRLSGLRQVIVDPGKFQP
jgi:glutamyl-Q tRNA(Asp) synthetase